MTRKMNWFGIVAGISMLILPFLGPWWRITVGTELVDLAVSPFDYNLVMLGEPTSVPLIWYVLLGAKLTLVSAGILTLVGSLLPGRWWSGRLMRFGAMKVMWAVVWFIAPILLLIFVANTFLTGWTKGLTLPYLVGSTTSTVQVAGATVTVPMSAALSNIFFVAICVAALGIAPRIYHRRFKPSGV